MVKVNVLINTSSPVWHTIWLVFSCKSNSVGYVGVWVEAKIDCGRWHRVGSVFCEQKAITIFKFVLWAKAAWARIARSVGFEPARWAIVVARSDRPSWVLPSVAATTETVPTWKWRVNGAGSGPGPPNMERWGHRPATPIQLLATRAFSTSRWGNKFVLYTASSLDFFLYYHLRKKWSSQTSY